MFFVLCVIVDRVVLPDGTIVRRLMSWISLRDQQINAGDRLLLEVHKKKILEKFYF